MGKIKEAINNIDKTFKEIDDCDIKSPLTMLLFLANRLSSIEMNINLLKKELGLKNDCDN